MENYICIHAHFYQPPRENPWLEAIECQKSAHPYHDWNQRIAAECYQPNGMARILDGSGRIDRILNNYSRISFNFGPTLLSWLAGQDPATYARILEADKESRDGFQATDPPLPRRTTTPYCRSAIIATRSLRSNGASGIFPAASAECRKACGSRRLRQIWKRWTLMAQSGTQICDPGTSPGKESTQENGAHLVRHPKSGHRSYHGHTKYSFRADAEWRSFSTTAPFHAPLDLKNCSAMAKLL